MGGIAALAGPLERGVPVVVISPHLDDAVLSCGAFLIHARTLVPVTVVTLFTEAPSPPYTLSARRYLGQVGATDAQVLYRERRAEDRAALESMGITCVHAGLTEALFRRRVQRERWPWWARLVPELVHVYPVYRRQITAGRLSAADAAVVSDATCLIRQHACHSPSLVLAPLGIGGHVDHVLGRAVAERVGERIVYYSDFPYNQRDRSRMAEREGLTGEGWSQHLLAKAELVQAYRTQARALFPDGHIPLVPEIYFAAPPARLTVAGNR